MWKRPHMGILLARSGEALLHVYAAWPRFYLTPTQKENMMTIVLTAKVAAPLIDLQSTQPLPSVRSASRPRFLDLINLHRVSMWRIARTARVPIGVVHTMLYNQPISPMLAAQVLAAFRRLTGTTYTLNDLTMRLLPIPPFGEKEG